MQEFVIGKNDANQRLDKYLFKLLPEAEHSLIFKQLRNKNIVVNGLKCKGSESLQIGDVVKVFMADDTIAKFRGKSVNKNSSKKLSASHTDLDVIYQDEDILIANKPAGMLSQKADPEDVSMNEWLADYLLSKNFDSGSTFHPSFCNRLDRNTSGLLLAGISLPGAQYLSEVLRDRSLEKYYLAVVIGAMKGSLKISGFLYKDEKTNKVSIFGVDEKHPSGAAAIETEYEVLAYNSEFDISLLRVHLITGKTHQIRSHLSFIGHPILGDMKYGHRGVNQSMKAAYQLLHAYQVIFPDKREFFAPAPIRIMKYFPEIATIRREEH